MRSASPQQTVLLAGLRSDQMGICREPQFQSKGRVHVNPPQIARSLQWCDPGVLNMRQTTTRPASSSSVVFVEQTENIGTPLAPRASKKSTDSTSTQAQDKSSSGDQVTQKQPIDGVKHVLRKKAGLMSERQRNIRQSSEYQRQFQRKPPVAESPLLNAHEEMYSGNMSIPPSKPNPVVIETEYQRCFKGSPPPRGPRLRKHMELNEFPTPKMENITPAKSKKTQQQHQHLNRKSRPKEKTLRSKSQLLEEKPEIPQAQNDVSPKVVRRVKTEYRSNFCSPLQYSYRDGAWVWSRTVREEVHDWYHEVQELRKKAEMYRNRALGTHFSRQHLNQIVSENNCLWEESSGSSASTLTEEDTHSTNGHVSKALDSASVRESQNPSTSVSLAGSRRSSCKEAELPSNLTLPGQKRQAWIEEVKPCEMGVAEKNQQRKEQPEETLEKENINGHSGVNKDEDAQSSEMSCPDGRVPTPDLRSMKNGQRTHHDRTTPSTGGAILVSPPNIKHIKTTRRTEPPRGKAHSPCRYVSVTEKKIENEHLSSSCSPLAAGISTVDSHPLREYTCANDSPKFSPVPKPAKKIPFQKANSAWFIDNTPTYASRNPGTLRRPEFQHNGKPGFHQPGRAVSLSSNCLSDDDLDDRLSQISFRSAASSSMASQILDRAQKRKDDFWGKS